MVDSSSPIFIVGRPRSGTTLMASLLDAHPRLGILPVETEIFSRWLEAEKIYGFEHMWSSFLADPKFDMLEFDWKQIRDRIEIHGPALSDIKSFLSAIGEAYCIARGKQRWGEKTPQHFRYLTSILAAYPHGRIICLLRDPRAIFASLLTTPWNQDNVEGSARNWIDLMNILRQRSSDSRIRVVKYERLVTEPENVMEELCSWLGEKYTQAMMDRSGLTHRLRKREGWRLEHRLKALDKITSESIDRWKNQLTDEQIRITEHLCAPLMRKAGYETISNGLTFAAGIRFDSHYRYIQIRKFLYRAKRKCLMLAKRVFAFIHRLVSHQFSDKIGIRF
jgi:hypothetical protein